MTRRDGDFDVEVGRPDTVGAHRRAQTIRDGMLGYLAAQQAIGEAFEAKDWMTLGHASWDEYCEKEFSEKRLQLTRDQREEAILAFNGLGMSVREIGSALGLPKSTVHNALKPPPPKRPDPDTETPAAVTAGHTDGPVTPVGEPDGSDLAVEPSGTPPLLAGVTPQDPPAAVLDDASQGVQQQPGQDSPVGREGDRPEFSSPTGREDVALAEDLAVATADGRSETGHHQRAGVSAGDVAPEVHASVEPVLEGGGTSLTPPSSNPDEQPTGDQLMNAFAVLVHHVGQVDADALGPVLHDDDLHTLDEHHEDLGLFIAKLRKARFNETVAGTP